MSEDLLDWKPRPRPERRTLEGRYVRLEPLEPAHHGDGLYEASTMSDSDSRFRWLAETRPVSRQQFQPWLDQARASQDPLVFVVIVKPSGEIAGRQSLMRIDANSGVAEIGQILWSSLIARTPAATEAQYLFQKYVFQALGYRRYEWKCHDLNVPSKQAALRFGFTYEGLFRQHLVFKGANRDTAWFSIIDKEWPALTAAYETWLDPANFDQRGRQRRRLAECIQEAKEAAKGGPQRRTSRDQG